MDPITDIFKTLHVTAVVQSRIEATAPWGLTHQATDAEKPRMAQHLELKMSPLDLAHFIMISRGNCWLNIEGTPEPVPLTGGDCILIAPGISYTLSDAPGTTATSFCAAAPKDGSSVIRYGGGGAPTTIIHGLFSFGTPSIRPGVQLLPTLMLIRADQARTLALHTTLQMLASEMSERAPGSEVVADRLAEILFIQTIRAHSAGNPKTCKQVLIRAIFDPQIGPALNAIHENVKEPWTVESLAASAGMSRSAFAARFKEVLGQTPLEYVTEWRMQKAIDLVRSDRKLIEIAQSIGYESDAAFSKAFKRVLGVSPGEFRKSRVVDALHRGASATSEVSV
jgi:AraC-like DNA-binding protein